MPSTKTGEIAVTVSKERLEEWINVDAKLDGFLAEYQDFKLKGIALNEDSDPILILHVDLYEDRPN